jgi:hypothetical protein
MGISAPSGHDALVTQNIERGGGAAFCGGFCAVETAALDRTTIADRAVLCLVFIEVFSPIGSVYETVSREKLTQFAIAAAALLLGFVFHEQFRELLL